jgi:hypothetical protein
MSTRGHQVHNCYSITLIVILYNLDNANIFRQTRRMLPHGGEDKPFGVVDTNWQAR